MLAAGASRRLGRPKQLVRHKGATLLERTVNAAVHGGADPVVVVLGAAADTIQPQLPIFPKSVRFVRHARWAKGMGTSIACGVEALVATDPTVRAVLILVCDQPRLNPAVLKRFLAEARVNPGKILLADHGAGRGPPVLFPRRYFGELLKLRGDTGARGIHRNHPEAVATIPFPGGAFDIDTPADLDHAKS